MSTSSPTTVSSREGEVPSPRQPADPERDDTNVKERRGSRGRVRADDPKPKQTPSRRSAEVKDTVIVVMGVGLLVTTPLAVVTVRRWIRWWRI
jgi:hypothetical protein